MIEKIFRYKTNDGKIHDSKKLAEEHILDVCREYFDKRLEPSKGEKPSEITNSQQFGIVMKALPDLESAIELFNGLKILDGVREDDVFDDFDDDDE